MSRSALAGQYVVSGHGEDADYGRVVEIAGRTMVAWLGSGSDQRTPYAPGNDDEVYDDADSARRAYETRA